MTLKELFKNILKKYENSRNARFFFEENDISISDVGFEIMLKKHGKREVATYTEEVFENQNLSIMFLEKQYTCLVKVIFSDSVSPIDEKKIDHFQYYISFFKSIVGVSAREYCSEEFFKDHPEIQKTTLGLMIGMFDIKWKTTINTIEKLPPNAYVALFEMNDVESIQQLGNVLLNNLKNEWGCGVQQAKPSFDHIKYIFYDSNRKVIANKQMNFNEDLEQFLIKVL